MVGGASQSTGLKGTADDLGVPCREAIQIDTDSTTAISIGSRLGTGQVRHIEVNQLWLQDKVYNGEITLNNVGTAENIAGAFTKAVNGETLQYHVDHRAAEVRRD